MKQNERPGKQFYDAYWAAFYELFQGGESADWTKESESVRAAWDAMAKKMYEDGADRITKSGYVPGKMRKLTEEENDHVNQGIDQADQLGYPQCKCYGETSPNCPLHGNIQFQQSAIEPPDFQKIERTLQQFESRPSVWRERIGKLLHP